MTDRFSSLPHSSSSSSPVGRRHGCCRGTWHHHHRHRLNRPSYRRRGQPQPLPPPPPLISRPSHKFDYAAKFMVF
ncbi:hypothetical protein E2C01_036855 [Portunus trituberculatus]|uniref:Uncharacterized protein n=1 Tax=Portunus trituberculatus TaxID=210409 RepID=A0A5B7FCI6_PORTR|nr:hypothetical protein [Portunus trituberculatus]